MVKPFAPVDKVCKFSSEENLFSLRSALSLNKKKKKFLHIT